MLVSILLINLVAWWQPNLFSSISHSNSLDFTPQLSLSLGLFLYQCLIERESKKERDGQRERLHMFIREGRSKTDWIHASVGMDLRSTFKMMSSVRAFVYGVFAYFLLGSVIVHMWMVGMACIFLMSIPIQFNQISKAWKVRFTLYPIPIWFLNLLDWLFTLSFCKKWN